MKDIYNSLFTTHASDKTQQIRLLNRAGWDVYRETGLYCFSLLKSHMSTEIFEVVSKQIIPATVQDDSTYKTQLLFHSLIRNNDYVTEQ